MTMVIFFPSTVESCGGARGISSREERVCPSSHKKEGVMTSSVESCGGVHGISSREEEVCSSYP